MQSPVHTLDTKAKQASPLPLFPCLQFQLLKSSSSLSRFRFWIFVGPLPTSNNKAHSQQRLYYLQLLSAKGAEPHDVC